jgi:hypothetical protein
MRLAKIMITLATQVVAYPALAGGYDEAGAGDLSSDRLNPTRVVLDYGTTGNNGQPGGNVVSGSLERSASGLVDRDYFTVVVPAGYRLTQLLVGNQTTVGGGGSFIGMAAGTVMPVLEDASSAAGLLGWKVYRLADRQTDILDDMAMAGNGASGFASPLGAGEYTFWVQELATGTFSYRFNLVLSPVPAPAPWVLMAGGLALLGWRRRGPYTARDRADGSSKLHETVARL